jgi:putative membrane protein
MNAMKKIIVGSAVAMLALFLAGPAAFGQHDDPQSSINPDASPTQTPHHHARSGEPMTDEQFAKEAAAGGMAEVKLGQLAEEKGTSESVKNFGKRMVEDHSKANDQLKATASQANINLPTDLKPKDQKTYDHLSSLSGAAFDKAYAEDMVRDHMHDVHAFRQEANNGTNGQIKSFASQTLPTLQEHLKLAKEMAGSVGAPVGKGRHGNGSGNTANPSGQQ